MPATFLPSYYAWIWCLKDSRGHDSQNLLELALRDQTEPRGSIPTLKKLPQVERIGPHIVEIASDESFGILGMEGIDKGIKVASPSKSLFRRLRSVERKRSRLKTRKGTA